VVPEPSANSTVRVMKLASSESRKHTGAAISSGSATRFWMLPCPNASAPLATSPPPRSRSSGSVMPLRVRPGAMTFTRTSGPRSRASWRENDRIAPFAAPYTELCFCPTTAATEATLTMDPRPRSCSCGSTCLHTRNVPPACTVSIRDQRSSDQSSIGPNSAWPPALNTQSTGPSRSRAAASAVRDPAALLGEPSGGGGAEPRPAAGHEQDPVVEAHLRTPA
jgi:hypothetical protein